MYITEMFYWTISGIVRSANHCTIKSDIFCSQKLPILMQNINYTTNQKKQKPINVHSFDSLVSFTPSSTNIPPGKGQTDKVPYFLTGNINIAQ